MSRFSLIAALGAAALAVCATCGGGDKKPVDAPPAKGCPVSLRFTSLAGGNALLGFGGTQSTALPIGGVFDADVISHDGDASHCSIAEIQGPVAHTADEQLFQRCLSNPRQTCSTDADCPAFACKNDALLGGLACENTGQPCSNNTDCAKDAQGHTVPGNTGTCKYILGSPLAYPPTELSPSLCVLIVFEKADGSPGFHGTMDLDHGTLNLDTFSIVSYTDPSGACNVCQNDDLPRDGVKHGTCSQGPATVNGVAIGPAPATNATCDIDGVNSAVPGSTSFDCAVPTSAYFMETVDNMAPSSTDGTRWTLDASRPVGSDGVTRTWCGTCKDAAGSANWQPCESAADCNGGTCVGTTPDHAVLAANACANGICNYDPINGGTCTRAGSGAQPTIFCLPGQNDQVATLPGASTVLDEDTYNVKVAGLACLPASRSLNPSSPLLLAEDTSIGLPGPLSAQIALQIEKIYSLPKDAGP
jgi:hypothetical protein